MASLAPVLHDPDFPLAELCAARLDGELFSVDEAFMPIDLCETPEHRARSLLVHCADKLIAELRTAAWIWGAAPAPPARLELCARMTARTRPLVVQRSTLREVVIDDDELRPLGGILVTSPLRTTVDIARSSADFTASDAQVVRELIRLGRLELPTIGHALDRRRNLPHKVRAMKRILQALASRPNPS